MSAKIEVHPASLEPARVTLAKAMEEVADGDTVFVVLISGDDIHVTSSAFKTRDLCWAAALLNANANFQVAR